MSSTRAAEFAGCQNGSAMNDGGIVALRSAFDTAVQTVEAE